MYSKVTSGAVHGIESYLISIETDISDGLPTFSMVGFLSGEVKEAAERVRVSMRNAGHPLPPARVTISVAPADRPKRGIIIDLPVAVGILISMGELPQEAVEGVLIAGELGLDGEVRPVRGALPIVEEARRRGLSRCILPAANVQEGAVVAGIRVVGVRDLSELLMYLRLPDEQRDAMLPPERVDLEELFRGSERSEDIPDFADVHGQESTKRALEIAAAGFHNLYMVGPPGAGKSMLAACLPGILPPMTPEESLEVSRIYSICGRIPEGSPLILTRQFQSPHHSVTSAALVGGGNTPMPGMISMAHRGVLFLDELPEFRRETLDMLRQPLEEHVVQIARSSGTYKYPARFQLIAAANPCPCGYYPDLNRCHCTMPAILRYQRRVSGPILDRIDLCVEVPKVSLDALMAGEKAEPSVSIRRRVERARRTQRERFRGTGFQFNADMNARAIEELCTLKEEHQRFLKELFSGMNLSGRGYHRILKVARTIADLDGSAELTEEHLAEAAGYRMMER